MADNIRQPALPARMEVEFSSLLKELSACSHQATALVGRARLPRWSRRPLFFFLGYIAKADGRVTEADIRYAEKLIKALKLSERQRQRAINWFQQGKSADRIPPLRGLLLRVVGRFWSTPSLKVAICLCHATQLEGRPAKPRRYRCEDSIDQIGLPISISDDIFGSYASKVWALQAESRPKPETYEQACELLGVTKRDSLDSIKHAYRRKVSECHPDKLAQQQLSSAELATAKERLLRYQQAWELVKRRHRLLR